MTQVTKKSIPESDQVRETGKRPNVAIGISKKRKFVKCKYCSDVFNSKVKFEVHRKYCKVYHISYHKFIGKCNDGFKCKVCYFKHLDRHKMLEHVKKKHRNDRLYNGIDGQNLTHVAGNRIRIISVSKKLCEYCFEEFKSNDWHFENLCQDSCKLYSEFIEVVTNQKQPKNFKCKLCGHNKDQGRKEIYKHIRTKHPKEIDSKRFETSNHEKENEKFSHSLHNVATNEGSKTNNEVLDKTEDASDDIEMTKESVQEYQEDDNADIDNSNEENNEDLLVRPIRNLAESTDILTDPFPEYEKISFDENSKQNANLIPTEENHKFAEENVVIKEGSKTANDAIVQSDENASIKSSSSKRKKVFIGKVSSDNLRRHIENEHGEDHDEFEKGLVQESPKANEFNLASPVEENHKTTEDQPTDKTHEKVLGSKIANVNEMSAISSNYENCKVCKVRILFKHINIHMKAKHPSSFEYQKIPRRSFQKWLG